MGCACGKSRQQFQVVNKDGKVVYTTSSKPVADAVAKRYPGSEVKPAPSKAA